MIGRKLTVKRSFALCSISFMQGNINFLQAMFIKLYYFKQYFKKKYIKLHIIFNY